MIANYIPMEHSVHLGYYKIPGYRNYVINTRGIVKQVGATRRRSPGEILKVHEDGSGQLKVCMSADDESQSPINLGYILCTAFNGKRPSDRHVARFLNNDKHDIRHDNVQWFTHSEKVLDCYKRGFMSGHGPTKKGIYAYNVHNKEIIESCDIDEISTIVQMPRNTIYKILHLNRFRVRSNWIFSYDPFCKWNILQEKFTFV